MSKLCSNKPIRLLTLDGDLKELPPEDIIDLMSLIKGLLSAIHEINCTVGISITNSKKWNNAPIILS